MKKTLIPEILRKYRNDLKLSAEEVVTKLRARDIDISEKTLYGYENGVSSPKVNTFLCLCDIYGIKNIMDEFGYNYSIASGDKEWDLSIYNDFFNAPLLDKLYILLKNGVPSFSGYEDQLNSSLPDDSESANLRRLISLFSSLNESQQSQAFFYLDEISAGRVPNLTSADWSIIHAYRQAADDDRQIIDNIVGRYKPASASSSKTG